MFTWFVVIYALSMASFGVFVLLDPTVFRWSSLPPFLWGRPVLIALVLFAVAGVGIYWAVTDTQVRAAPRGDNAVMVMGIMAIGLGVPVAARWVYMAVQLVVWLVGRARRRAKRTDGLSN